MPEVKLKRGDPCPSCGGDLKDARVPTEEQRAAATRRDDPIFLPVGYDTASADFRAEHGALARCPTCGYQTRLPIDDKNGETKSAA